MLIRKQEEIIIKLLRRHWLYALHALEKMILWKKPMILYAALLESRRLMLILIKSIIIICHSGCLEILPKGLK